MIRLVRLLRRLVAPLCEKPLAVAEFVLIVAISATVAGDFAFAAGWVTPGRITTLTIIEALEPHDGPYRGSIGARAKGRAVERNSMYDQADRWNHHQARAYNARRLEIGEIPTRNCALRASTAARRLTGR
jgi:hypothetical protein